MLYVDGVGLESACIYYIRDATEQYGSILYCILPLSVRVCVCVCVCVRVCVCVCVCV